MDSAPIDYNIATIRELLLDAFTPAELRRFCQNRSTFHPICKEFGPGQGLTDMVDRVIDYCETRDLFDELLAAIKEDNPQQYRRFEPRLLEPHPYDSVYPAQVQPVEGIKEEGIPSQTPDTDAMALPPPPSEETSPTSSSPQGAAVEQANSHQNAHPEPRPRIVADPTLTSSTPSASIKPTAVEETPPRESVPDTPPSQPDTDTHASLQSTPQNQENYANPWERVQGWWKTIRTRCWPIAAVVVFISLLSFVAGFYNDLTGKPFLDPLRKLIPTQLAHVSTATWTPALTDTPTPISTSNSTQAPAPTSTPVPLCAGTVSVISPADDQTVAVYRKPTGSVYWFEAKGTYELHAGDPSSCFLLFVAETDSPRCIEAIAEPISSFSTGQWSVDVPVLDTTNMIFHPISATLTVYLVPNSVATSLPGHPRCENSIEANNLNPDAIKGVPMDTKVLYIQIKKGD